MALGVATGIYVIFSVSLTTGLCIVIGSFVQGILYVAVGKILELIEIIQMRQWHVHKEELRERDNSQAQEESPEDVAHELRKYNSKKNIN